MIWSCFSVFIATMTSSVHLAKNVYKKIIDEIQINLYQFQESQTYCTKAFY